MRWLPIMAWGLASAAAVSGCATLHESMLRQRLYQSRFELTDAPRSLAEVDGIFGALPRRGPLEACDQLCLESTSVRADGARTYCFVQGDQSACVVAHGVEAGTRLAADPPVKLPRRLLASLWAQVDPEEASAAHTADDSDVPELVAEEARRFAPRLSFIAGARTATVSGVSEPSFMFGGQAGVRYWASAYVVPGAALEVETVLSRHRPFFAAAIQVRVELAVWTPENARFLNLPAISFLMAAMPVLAFGGSLAIGGRALVGVHVTHLASIPTPVFLEFGYQVLTAGQVEATGLRIALGLGF